jgi:hypothetical protein
MPKHYPRAEEPLDADEKRALAISGDLKQSHPPSQYAFFGTVEWRTLIGLATVAFLVRLHQLSQPDSVV